MSKQLNEELQYLANAIEGDTFHFVVVQWKHFDLVRQTKDFLRLQFPERTALSLNVADENYESLMDKIYTQGSGLVFLDDFEALLADPDFYVPFNQRRGKMARLALSMICFVPPGEKYLEYCATRIPDWWSVLTLLAELEPPPKKPETQAQFQENFHQSTLAGTGQENRLDEIRRLKDRILKTEIKAANASLLDSLYRHALELCETAGLYQEGLNTTNDWLKQAFTLEYEHKSPETFAEILDRLGRFAQDLGHYDRAARLMEKALALDLKNFGADHPTVAVSQSNLATVYRNLGLYEKARDLLESALASDLKNFGKDHPTVAIRQLSLGAVFLKTGEKEKANVLFRQAYELFKKQLGEQHPSTQRAKKWLEAEG